MRFTWMKCRRSVHVRLIVTRLIVTLLIRLLMLRMKWASVLIPSTLLHSRKPRSRNDRPRKCNNTRTKLPVRRILSRLLVLAIAKISIWSNRNVRKTNGKKSRRITVKWRMYYRQRKRRLRPSVRLRNARCKWKAHGRRGRSRYRP